MGPLLVGGSCDLQYRRGWARGELPSFLFLLLTFSVLISVTVQGAQMLLGLHRGSASHRDGFCYWSSEGRAGTQVSGSSPCSFPGVSLDSFVLLSHLCKQMSHLEAFSCFLGSTSHTVSPGM